MSASGAYGTCLSQGSASVSVQPPPALTISVSPASPAAGTTAVVTVDGPSACTTVNVNFGGGNVLTFMGGSGPPLTGTYVFPSEGTYAVTAVGLGGACPSTGSTTVSVQPPPPLSISVSPASPTVGVAALVTINGRSACTTVNVNFGDGTMQTYIGGSGPPITNAHTWWSTGTKTVTAQGLGGACDFYASTTITVVGPPAPDTLAAADAVARALPALTSGFDAVSFDLPAAMPAGAAVASDVDWSLEGEFDAGSATASASDLIDAVLAEASSSASTPVTLTVNLRGTGDGTVSADGLSCTGGLGVACSHDYESGQVVTLTASANTGTFAGWGGACSGAGACTVTLAQSTLVVATFTLPPPTVTQYYHLDVIGSVRAVTDETGALIRRYDDAVFGEDLAGEEPLHQARQDYLSFATELGDDSLLDVAHRYAAL